MGKKLTLTTEDDVRKTVLAAVAAIILAPASAAAQEDHDDMVMSHADHYRAFAQGPHRGSRIRGSD